MAALPQPLASLFTTDPAVIATAATLMLVAAAFQLFDGLQGVSTGTMRGAGDTHTAMFCNLVAHWGIGLPLGYLLAFTAGYGILGLWVGLALGLGGRRAVPAPCLDPQGPVPSPAASSPWPPPRAIEPSFAGRSRLRTDRGTCPLASSTLVSVRKFRNDGESVGHYGRDLGVRGPVSEGGRRVA